MKCFKLIGIISLLSFSFFLTDFVTELAINSNPLMQSIKKSGNNYNVCSVNATIENNTIIPGIKGKKVNEMESFINMKDFGIFNINYLIYDDVIPDISIENNKDKIIISGNKNIRQVSILVKDNSNIIEYNNKNNIKYSKLINSNDKLDIYENINICSNSKDFNNLDILLNKNELNKKICILNYSNIEECRENEYYIIKPSIVYSNSNYVNKLNDINSGSIILLNDNLSINNYKLLIEYLKNKDLEIVYLSELIKE